MIPVLRSTVGTYLRIEGSAGWAGGKGLDESRVNALAFERARAVQSYVLKYGISADRRGAEHGGAPLPGVRRGRRPARRPGRDQLDDHVGPAPRGPRPRGPQIVATPGEARGRRGRPRASPLEAGGVYAPRRRRAMSDTRAARRRRARAAPAGGGASPAPADATS